MNKKIDDIKKLLPLMGLHDFTQSFLEKLLRKNLNRINPRISDNAIKAISEIFKDNAEAMSNHIVSVYDKYYNGAEIKQLLRFYTSKIGKKSIALTPTVAKESLDFCEKLAMDSFEKNQDKIFNILKKILDEENQRKIKTENERYKFVLNYVESKGWGELKDLIPEQFKELKEAWDKQDEFMKGE